MGGSDDDAPRPWWQAAFTATYEVLYAHRSDAAAGEEVAAVLDRVGRHGPVLDACCGNGRHLAALRRAGVPCWGFDYSQDLLASAAQRSDCRGRLVRADLRRLPVAAGWQAVLLFFTAFGYFDDAGNRLALQRLGSLLAPGGWLMLDLPEPDRLRRELVPESEAERAGYRLVERRRLAGNRVEKEVQITAADGRQQCYTESVRLYRADELAGMAVEVGLQLVDSWPSLLGSTVDQGRLVHWFRRAENLQP